MSNIEIYKKDISEKYIKEFKEELNFFEKIMISPITNKMKSILSSDKEISVDNLWDLEDIWFWWKVLWAKIWDKELFGTLTSKTFDFLKNKQKEIILASTSGSLRKLYQEVIEWKTVAPDTPSPDQWKETNEDLEENADENWEENTDTESDESEDSGPSNAQIWVGTSVVWWLMGGKIINNIEKWKLNVKVEKYMKETSQFKRSQRLMNDAWETMIESSKNPNFTGSQRKNFEKIWKKYKEYAKNFDDPDVAEAFMHLDDMRDKIDVKKLLKLNMSEDLMKAFKELDPNILEKMMQSRDVDSFKKVFKSHTGFDVPDQIYDIVKRVDGIDEASIVFRRILPRINGSFKGACNWLKAIWFLDFAALGLDVFIMMETLDEAEMIEKRNEVRGQHKRNQAYAHMWVAVLWLAWEITACATVWSVWWPVWVLIWVWIWWIAYWIDEALDYYRFDKVDFYSQNQKDYMMTERTYIKQSIYQSAMSQELVLNQSIIAQEKRKWIDTFEDAFRAMIFLEELMDYSWKEPLQNLSLMYNYVRSEEDQEDFASSLWEEEKKIFNSDINNLNKIIDTRMEYVSKYLEKWNNKNTKLVKSIRNMQGIKEIEKIVSESEIYYDMKTDNSEYMWSTNYQNIDDYNTAYKNKLENENPVYFQKLEEIFNEDLSHYRFWEIYYGSEYFRNILVSDNEDWSNEDWSKDNKIKNIDFIQQYWKWKKLNMSIEEEWHINHQFNSFDYSWISNILEDIDKNIDKVDSWWTQDAVNYFAIKDSFWSRAESVRQVSSLTSQNIIYRIAREFHGYDGQNEERELIKYFSESSWDNKWFYYNDWWMLNVGWLDKSISFSSLNDLNFSSEEDLTKKADLLIKWLFYKRVPDKYDENGIKVRDWYYKKLRLDSNAEAYDQGLIDEYISRIDQIIKEELRYNLVSTKKEIEQDIVDFVKSNSKIVESSVWGEITKERGYVQLPQHLVIKAKKTGIWNIESYLFKIDKKEDSWETSRTSIVALTTQNMVDQDISFDQTNINIRYEAITPLRDEVTTEEKKIIDKVREVHNKVEELRNIGWSSFLGIGEHEDDLDIPVKIERLISTKWHERQNIERDLLCLSPLSAEQLLKEKWQEYYNYFNNIYIGVLYNVSHFSVSNDLDSSRYMAMIFSMINRPKYQIKNDSIDFSHLKDLEDDELESLKSMMSNKYHWYDKTVEELLLSGDENEKFVWEQILDQIFMVVFEGETVTYDPDSMAIRDISITKNHDDWIANGYNKSLQVMRESPIITLDDIDAIDRKNFSQREDWQSIRDVHPWEKEVYSKLNEVVDGIIGKMDNVDRAGKRWEPDFIPNLDKSTDDKIVGKFYSWEMERELVIDMSNGDIQRIKIKWLDITFWAEEAFRTANLINWIDGYYLTNHPDASWEFNFWSRTGKLYVDDSILNDTDILESNTINLHYSKLKIKSNQTKFLNYINKL